MANSSSALRLAAFVDDLDATLQDSDRIVCHLERELTHRAERQRSIAVDDRIVSHVYQLLAVSAELLEEARRLRENVRAARETMIDLRAELALARMHEGRVSTPATRSSAHPDTT